MSDDDHTEPAFQQPDPEQAEHQGPYQHPPNAVMPREMATALRAEFPPSAIGKLPRTTCRACSTSQSKVCDRHSKSECQVCGNYMTGAHIHLDYVGHAAVTDRLLQVDPDWTWEPVAYDPTGLPMIARGEKVQRMWIRLTIGGVTRLGVGIAEGWKDEVEKELISDAIRNASMRFGVALDLWSKEDLHAATHAGDAPPPPPPATHAVAGGDPTNIDQAKITEVTRRIDTLAPDQREAFVVWKDQQGFPWPWPRAACLVMLRQMDALTGEGSQDPTAENATTAPQPPPPGQTADPAASLPPADDLPVDGPCELCGSTRAAKAIVHGVRRCQNAHDCRKRVEAAEAARIEAEAQAAASTEPGAHPPEHDGPAEETGDETLHCTGCHEAIVGELPVFGDADEPYHVACSPAFSGAE